MYRIELRERVHSGPEIATERSQVRYPSIRQATAAAKEEAFIQTALLQMPVAIRVIGPDQRTMILFVMPALPVEAQRALFGPPPLAAHFA